MKKGLLLTACMACIIGTWAQTTITNGNMEAWQNAGAANQEPTQWNSTKTAGGACGLCTSNAPQTVWQEATNPHAGTYCTKVVTGNVLGTTTVNGSLTTGQITIPSFTASEGFIQTVTTNADFNMPFTGRPDSLVFWYRSTPVGVDYPAMEVRLHTGSCQVPEIPVNGNHPLDTANIVARASWQGTSSAIASWTRVAIPFVYRSGASPQYVLITGTSSGNPSSPQQGSILWVDDVDVIYNPTIATGTINPLAYYVSATQGEAVNVPYTLTSIFGGGNTVTAELSNAAGSFAASVTIGSLTSGISGTISATIPAGTATGTGYRIRVKSSNPLLTATDNGANIAITLVSNSIAPSSTQNILANANGSVLTVTETPTALSREWKFSITSGSGYQSLGPLQTGTTYTPNFATAGTYYVVCASTFTGGLVVNSNQVQVNVVANSIAPSSSQSILVGANGTLLTVTETPTGTSREWKYATFSGGPYGAFSPTEMATGYTPNFANAGNYYVVCESMINGVTVSNEVLISVGIATIATGAIAGSPFLFSPNAPHATVNVPYTITGSFTNGNVFTAQLSNANGSFASATDIGTVNATTSGNISATVPHTTPAGIGYRIRVVSSLPNILGSDNGSNLIVDQFNNSISPSTTQTILYAVNGTSLQVSASQSATNIWRYTLTSGSAYMNFAPAQTGNNYMPNFATLGTYYVVAVSTNQYTDSVISNEVQVIVTNGNSIVTSAIGGSPFLVSASLTAPVNVNFTSNVLFSSGNIFKAQLSDIAGSFASPTEIGILNGVTIGTISATIPSAAVVGTGYRIRVVSTNPAVTGTDNGTDLEIIPFANEVSPTDTQFLQANQNGNAISITATHTATQNWKYSSVSGSGYNVFNPAETGNSFVPNFSTVGNYYIVCESKNAANDIVTSEEVLVVVDLVSGISNSSNNGIKVFWNGSTFIVDMSDRYLGFGKIKIFNLSGQLVFSENLVAPINRLATNLPTGIYSYRISTTEKKYSGKTII